MVFTLFLYIIVLLMIFGGLECVCGEKQKGSIVLIGIIAYGFVMRGIRNNIVLKWCVYCVECLITGGSILYTPAMIISFVSGLKKGHYAVTYLMSALPKTSIGKAISSSITSAAVFIAFALTLESQYGSICNVFASGLETIKCFGSIIIMLMGIYYLLTSTSLH